jgi:hypothetical protein
MSIPRMTLVAVTLAAFVSPAFADGFQYSGSPKFGEFYIYTSAQTSRADTMSRQMPLNANAAMASDKTPFKGGIGNRAP